MKHKFFKFQNFPITSTPHCSTPPPCVQTRRNHVYSNSTRSKLATRLFGKLKEKKKKEKKNARSDKGPPRNWSERTRRKRQAVVVCRGRVGRETNETNSVYAHVYFWDIIATRASSKQERVSVCNPA